LPGFLEPTNWGTAMSDLFSDAAALVNSVLEDYGATLVTYARGSEEITVAATIGETVFRLNQNGGVTRMQARDFIISAASLVIGGGQTTPRRGDRITQTTGSTSRTFEVLAPGGEPEWRWSDRHHSRLRIHTKEITNGNR